MNNLVTLRDLLLVEFPLMLGRHMVPDNAATDGAQHAMVRQMSGKPADNRALQAPFGLHRPRNERRDNKAGHSR